MVSSDPLQVLPPEIVLRVLQFVPISTIGALTSVSKSWYDFIDVTHQDTIFGFHTIKPFGHRDINDLSFLKDGEYFSQYFGGNKYNHFDEAESWKEACKRQVVLARNWDNPTPTTQETLFHGGKDVWRFHTDFKRRFILATHHTGGLSVIDMDSHKMLWELPEIMTPRYAHLEYQDGIMVFDGEGDSLQVWQTDLDDTQPGEFKRIAVLDHDRQVRGFQLSYSTLCVVSCHEACYVWDMIQRPPTLKRFNIEKEAGGHLHQSEDVVFCAIGQKGYFAYKKTSGELLGVLEPSSEMRRYHITAPKMPKYDFCGPHGDPLTPIQVCEGPLHPTLSNRLPFEEWGSGRVDGDLFVGISRSGNAFVCSDWRKSLQDPERLVENSSILECYSDGSSFDIGGWLAVRNHRFMFEAQGRIYVIGLDDNNRIQNVESPAHASYSLLPSAARQFKVPVSAMELCDDAILTTYITIGTAYRNHLDYQHNERSEHELGPLKCVRVVRFTRNLPGVPASFMDYRRLPLDHISGHLRFMKQVEVEELLRPDPLQAFFAAGGRPEDVEWPEGGIAFADLIDYSDDFENPEDDESVE